MNNIKLRLIFRQGIVVRYAESLYLPTTVVCSVEMKIADLRYLKTVLDICLRTEK